MGENPHCFFHFHSPWAQASVSLPGSCSASLLVSLPPVSLSFSCPSFTLLESTWNHVSHLDHPWHPAHRIKFQLFVLAFQVFYLLSNWLFSITSTDLYIPSLCYLSPNPTPPSPKKKRNSFLNFCFVFFKAWNTLSLDLQLKLNFAFKACSEHYFLFPLSNSLPSILKMNHLFLVSIVCVSYLWHSFYLMLTYQLLTFYF